MIDPKADSGRKNAECRLWRTRRRLTGCFRSVRLPGKVNIVQIKEGALRVVLLGSFNMDKKGLLYPQMKEGSFHMQEGLSFAQ